jgi:hypothetical protein
MFQRPLLLLCGLSAAVVVLVAGTATDAAAQACPTMVTGSIDATNAASKPMTVGRLARLPTVATPPTPGSICGALKGFPGIGRTGAYPYDIYHFVNTGTTSACFTFDMTFTASAMTLVSVYSTFDPANLQTNLVGDSGSGTTSPQTIGVTVAAGAGVDVVVQMAPESNSYGSYTLAASGCGMMTATANATVSSSSTTTVAGQMVTFTASVTGAAGTPTGNVTFRDLVGGTSTSLATVALGASGTAALPASALSVGTHSISIVYAGDGVYPARISPPITQTVGKAGSTATVVSSQNPQTLGNQVTFSATVSPVAPSTATPTGTVTFLDGGASIGSGTLAGGQASFMTSALAAGDHSITARYEGDASFAASTSAAITQSVQKLVAAVAVANGPNPSLFGQAVTITATVSGGGGIPSGTVTFSDGVTSLGAPVDLTGGTATLTTSALNVGDRTITATYGGDAIYASATGTAAQTVAAAASATALGVAPTPSVFGQAVTATATVTSTAGTPSVGNVVFMEGSTMLATVALGAGGTATLTLSTLAVGTHSLSASYLGGGSFSGSASPTVDHIVNKAATTVAVGSSSSPSLPGASVTFMAVVTASAPGAGTPTGSVSFSDGTTSLGPAALVNGTATLSTSALTVGTHDITAVYAGDASFVGSTSAPFAQTVGLSAATATIAAAPNPSTYGQDVTFTATIAATTSGTPTGDVTFKEGAAALGTATLNGGGVAALVTHTLTAGTHAVTVTYAGDANHAGGAAATVSQVVTVRSTTTILASSPRPSTAGQAITLTASISADSISGADGGPSDLAPLTGTVTFKEGSTTIGTGTITNGVATFTTSTLAAGSHSLTAGYGGATNYAASASAPLVHQVDPAPQPDGGADGGVTDAAGDARADAGTQTDGGVDRANGDARDAGAAGDAADAGKVTSGGGGGCGCRIDGDPISGAGLLGACAALLVLTRRRRSCRRP